MVRQSRIRAGIVIGLVATGLILLQASAVLAAGASVTINNYTFTPKSIAVTPGSTVTWTNKQADDNHTVTADNGSFDTGVIAKNGGSATLTVATAGAFAYHCKIHPSMHGTVVVSANAQQPPATDTTEFGRGDARGSPPLPFALLLVGLAFLMLAGAMLLRRSTRRS